MSDQPQSRAILPPGWPQPRGYANGMVAEGRVLVTGGLVGWYAEGVFAEGFIGQLRQTFLIVSTAGTTPASGRRSSCRTAVGFFLVHGVL